MTEDLLAEFRGNIYQAWPNWQPLIKLFVVEKVYNTDKVRIMALNSKLTYNVGIEIVRKCKSVACIKELVESMLVRDSP